MKSIYVATADDDKLEAHETSGSGWEDASVGSFWGRPIGASLREREAQSQNGQPRSSDNGSHGVDSNDDNKDDESGSEKNEDLDESEPEPLTLPESTHSLFFTQQFCSTGVLFATSIVVISIMCLVMAFIDNLENNATPGNNMGVPANISPAVRIAQYLAIFIALLMEEEIPTGIQLLRTIPKQSFKKKFPHKSYWKFMAAAALRIVLGYTFLINVFLILAQATGVLDIFYDVLALQFISELDDMAFLLAKKDVFGKQLQRACTAKLFQTEFEKQKFGRSKKASIFLKSIYFLNLGLFLAGMIFISMRQTSGFYQCDEITIDFGEGVWEDPLVLFDGEFSEFSQEFTLVFSYFNGVYKQDGTEAGRPVYKEMRKFDNQPYGLPDESTPAPALIKYSMEADAWILTHPSIKKSRTEDAQSESWLLRSPETDAYDLLDVPGEWSIWLGVIGTTTVNYSCDWCNEDTECNLNGKCINQICVCSSGKGISYLGTHCEVKLKDECGTITTEDTNITYAIEYYSSVPGGPADTLFQEYDRPVYTHVSGYPGVREGDLQWLVYTGRRWIGMTFNLIDLNVTAEDLVKGTKNYHAFWDVALGVTTMFISDPTTGDNPVGVDFYYITDRGPQLWPLWRSPVTAKGQYGWKRCLALYWSP